MVNRRSSNFMAITLSVISIFTESCVYSKIHGLKVEQDDRTYIELGTYGFLKEGTWEVNMTKFSVTAKPSSEVYRKNHFEFILLKIPRSGAEVDMETAAKTCISDDILMSGENREFSMVIFRFDFQENMIHIERSGKAVKNLIISNRYGSGKSEVPKNTETEDVITTLPLQKNSGFYSAYFLVHIRRDAEEGVYRLYFLNCHGSNGIVQSSSIDLTVNLVEHNVGNFLSAGEIPIPLLYFVSTAVYLAASLLWAAVLHRYKKDVMKIHYLMLSVVVFTSLACFFQAVNMYYIGKEGLDENAWAVMYYTATLCQRTLFFITILLLGIGFNKHVLSCRKKIFFAIVIPIQVLDSIALVLVEKSEEEQLYYEIWSVIAVSVDLICWIAILCPLAWSVRICKQDSNTKKLKKLFRQFYLMIVCYIYFTKVIVYLLKMLAPFRYEWLTDLLKEITTAVFLVLMGYKFRPAPYNLYLQVPQESNDIKMDEVITKQESQVLSME